MKLLNKNIVKKLSKKKLKISLAESCTGGLLSSTITSISGDNLTVIRAVNGTTIRTHNSGTDVFKDDNE